MKHQKRKHLMNKTYNKSSNRMALVESVETGNIIIKPEETLGVTVSSQTYNTKSTYIQIYPQTAGKQIEKCQKMESATT